MRVFRMLGLCINFCSVCFEFYSADVEFLKSYKVLFYLFLYFSDSFLPLVLSV